MEKTCVKCGKKIGLLDFKYNLAYYEDALFCKDCTPMINNLLIKIRIPSIPEHYDKAVKEFLAEVSQSDLNDKTKHALTMEAKLGYVQFEDMTKPYSVTCNMPFEYACNLIRSFAIQIGKIHPKYENIYKVSDVNIGFFTFHELMSQYSEQLIVATVIHWSGISKIEIAYPQNKWDDYTTGEKIFLLMTRALEPFNVRKTEETESIKGRIGVFGGSFDPIHLGHMALAQAAVEEGNLEKLIVMPVYLQPFKQGRRVTDDEHRLAMARLAFEKDDKIEVSSFEIDKMGVSYTYDTLDYLRSEYSDKELYFVTGTDAFLEIETWYRGAELLSEFSFMVSSRPGYREEELFEKIQYYQGKYRTTVIRIQREMPDISSTEIRRRYENKLKADDLVSDAVERYIKENGLYGTNKRVY